MKIAVFILLVVFFAESILQAEEYSLNHIMQKVIDQRRVEDEVVEIKMILIDSKNRQWIRTGTFFRKKKNKTDDMYLFRFETPADLARSGVLTIENSNGKNDQWVYIPAYHTSRLVPPSDRSDRYLGTDFFYEDIINMRIEDYKLNKIGEEYYQRVTCLIIESIPISEKLKKESAYLRKISWIDPNKFILLKEELYDKNNVLLKVLTNQDFQLYEGKYFLPTKTEMTNVQTKHKTIVEYRNRRLNKGLSDDIFTLRYLKRG